jgi:phosphatidylserine/phosphatidylglycerophosphate/cardiolipin synthase-like enzyme
MPQPRNNNHAKFLLDGGEYFSTLRRLIEWTYTSVKSLNRPRYIRLGWWCINIDTMLPGVPGRSLAEALQTAHDAGVHIQVMVWDPGELVTLLTSLGQIPQNHWIVTTAKHNHHTMKVIKEMGGSAVMESYPGLVWAQHQKIGVFCNGPDMAALTGGINLEPQYVVDAQHKVIFAYDNTQAGACGQHDTGVLLTGPVALDIENNWLERWEATKSVGAKRKTYGFGAIQERVKKEDKATRQLNIVEKQKTAFFFHLQLPAEQAPRCELAPERRQP